MKNIVEAVLFLVVLSIYCFGISDSINFWDSPEFMVSNYTFQASHPPGAPLYTMLSSMVLVFFSSENTALVCNAISAFFGALTALIVFKITYLMALQVLEKYLTKYLKPFSIASGALASLSLAFSTSFWTASIETEVYTMSFALFSILIYIMLLWYSAQNKSKAFKLMSIFFLVLGLAVGVHMILMACVLPFCLLIVIKKHNLSLKSLALGLLFGLLSFVFIQRVVIGKTISVASSIDQYAVNQLDFAVNTGALLFFVLLLVLLVLSHLIFQNYSKPIASQFCLFVLVFLAGSSSYLLPLMTSETNTLVAEKVDTPQRLQNYISGQRFGLNDIPLLYGPVYNAQLDTNRPFLNTEPIYTYDASEKKYIETHDGLKNQVNYSSKFKMLFPRMFDANNAPNYRSWTTVNGKKIQHKIQDSLATFTIPTFSENLSFFYNYQVSWLNLRYLYWNFIGRQNDRHGLGYIKDGNWVSGIGMFDDYRVGDPSFVPEHYQTNKASDSYYFIPFLLGLIGFVFLLRHYTYSWIMGLLFLIFGLGITVYVNPLPSSILIRERDYIFIGSFIIFSIWIGLSLAFILLQLQKITKKTLIHAATGIIIFVLVPGQLLAKGWDNHQNSNDRFAYEFGKSFLEACPEQAILITNGDNMTFPLWYIQEVEGFRTDVRVINFDQLNVDTHIENLKGQKLASLPIQLDLNKSLYLEGIEKLVPFQKETNEPINLEVLTKFINSDKTLTNWNGRSRHYIPGNIFEVSIDSTVFKDLSSTTYHAGLLKSMIWTFPKDFYGLNDIVLLNIIKNNINQRPICFANIGKESHKIGLNPFLIHKGMVSQLAPIARMSKTENPKLVDTKVALKHLVSTPSFTPFNSDLTYVKDENKTYAATIIRSNYYFLAQALFEENNTDQALKTIETCLELFPNDEVAFKQYAFALGKLYFKIGQLEKGNAICQTAMHNVWQELQWMTSIDPPNPIINIKHANNTLYNMYKQMNKQIKAYNESYALANQKKIEAFNVKFNEWVKTNWPYDN